MPHHVTQRGNNRCQVFFTDDDRRFYLAALRKYAQAYGVEVWAYCLMDNHVHVLGVPESEESLARCFGSANLVYTQYINRAQVRSGRLWQSRFFSCPVDKDAYLWPVLRYIERNPVRAGLVRLPWEYEWSSARHHAQGQADGVVSEPGWLATELLKRRYRSYVQQDGRPGVTAAIRRTTLTGRPLGSVKFTALLESKLDRELVPGRPGRPRKGKARRR